MKTALPPLSIYMHLPWCVSKCPYCDFNSHKATGPDSRDRYVAAIVRDVDAEAQHALGRRVDTIFIGGGTPSLFGPDQIAEMLATVHRAFDVGDDAEITMEANPGAIERGDLGGYRDAGVTRLSLGVQSFDEKMLGRLGRIHGPDEVIAAYEEARSAAFQSINTDLMFALPGQTIDAALADIDRAIALAPEHISYYQLTLEPNTVFYSRPPRGLPDDDSSFEIQEACHDRLGQAGYQQYEVSAFAKPGFECRHNLNYWSFGDYLGVGAGAHGKYTDSDGRILRSRKTAHPMSYMGQAEAGRPEATAWQLDTDDILFEFMLNALRLPSGFTAKRFEARTGLPFERLRERLQRTDAAGLLECGGDDRWRPTELGFRFLNDLQAAFLPADRAS